MGRRAPHNGMVEIGCCTPLFGPWILGSPLPVPAAALSSTPRLQGLAARLVHEPLGVQLKLHAPSSLSLLVTFFPIGGASCPGVAWHALDGLL